MVAGGRRGRAPRFRCGVAVAPGTVVLTAALTYHLGYAFYAVFRRSHLRLPALEWVRLALAFAIPFILVRHVMLSGVVPRTAGVDADYPFIIGSMWLIDPTSAVLQGVLLVLVWGHLGIGVYAWLRHRP